MRNRNLHLRGKRGATANLLQDTFGLTAAGAAVALSLGSGASAEARGVSVETVRSHLKTILTKTGTKRQATLVALIVRMRGLASSTR